MESEILNIIPKKFRRKGYLVACTIFLRAILNFIGLAMMLPILILVLDMKSIHTNRWFEGIYQYCGFSSDKIFIIWVCVAVVATLVIKNLLTLALYKVERNYVYKLYNHLSRNLYVEYYNRGLAFIKGSNSAMLARNVNVVTLTFVTGILKPIAAMAGDVTLVLLMFIGLTIYSPLLSMMMIIMFIPTIVLYYYLVRRRLNIYGEVENRAHREKARTVVESFRGYSDIEINNAFPAMLDNFQRSMDEIIGTRLKEATISMLPQIFIEIGLGLGIALLILANMNLGGEMKILLGVFAVAALRIMPSIRSILSAWASVRYNKYSMKILQDANLDDDQASVITDNNRIQFHNELKIDKLSFHFEDDQTLLFENLSFTIRKGERIGIKGSSGAGKTTLFNLLIGFYTPTSGCISIDGKILGDANRRAWQNNIGYVSQNVFISDSTFLANIALGYAEQTIDRTRVAQALESAKLKEFIDTLPNGMDTRIGECGCKLSGGQRQRIGIARALYKQADILLFDEATSALDNATEMEITHAIEDLSQQNRELTIIIIAHRDTSLTYCDRIITIGEN